MIMPAGSIMNGCTGSLRPATSNEFLIWKSVVELGIDENINANHAAKLSMGKHLHCIELWMPGGCNLTCKHCYVAPHRRVTALTPDDYYRLTSDFVRHGLIDVVVPGMEPLLRSELWSVLEAAGNAGARSVGLTTNGTHLEKQASRLHDSSLTVLNVSLDGPTQIHDKIRGEGVHAKLEDGVREFRRRSDKRLLTNTTVLKANIDVLTDIAEWSRDHDVDYAAFHPFELADNAENRLALDVSEATSGYVALFNHFHQGKTSSIVLEAEASTYWVIVNLASLGVLDSSDLVIDEAGFLFLRETHGNRELLVGLNFYPHHYIRTIRLTDDGGFSSCRSMARHNWKGAGDVLHHPMNAILAGEDALSGLSLIWGEFKQATKMLPTGTPNWFINFVRRKARHERFGVPCGRVDSVSPRNSTSELSRS